MKQIVASILFFCCINVCSNSYIIRVEEPVPHTIDYGRERTEVNISSCTTVECKTTELLVNNLNLSVDPCVDFYEYACGGWIRNNPVPKSQSHRNQFQVVEEKLYDQIKNILEKNDPNDPLPVQAASLYYRSCMDTDLIEAEGLNQLEKLLNEYGGWPMAMEKWNSSKFNWIEMSSDLIRRFSIMSLMHIYVSLDRMDSNRSVLIIDQPTMVLPRSMLTEPQAYKTHLEAYKDWIGASALMLAQHTKQNVDPKLVEKQASDVLLFEIKLAKLTSTNEMRKNSLRTYNNMTLRNLQEWTDSASPSFKIDWLEAIRKLFSKTDLTIEYTEPVIVKEYDFFFNLVVLLQQTPVEVLANYLHWRAVKTFCQDSTDEMRLLVHQFDQVFSGVRQNEPRWKDCVTSILNVFRFAVGYKYVTKHFDEESKNMAKQMVDNILSVFSENLNNADWMDDPTKAAALEKVNAMTLFIGYPEWYKNVSALYAYYDGVTVGSSHFENLEELRSFLYHRSLMQLRRTTNRNEWLTGPAIVNAFNNEYMNSIILPAGILQLPFFDIKRLMAMNYGSMGAVIGHEILHSFDDSGRLTDKYGNLAQWWTEDVIVTYQKKTQCFVDQYNKFIIPVVAPINQSYFSVNGFYTQGENIADNSGLRQAYFAYQKYTRENGPEKSLQGIQQFSPEQLFFISYATAWCETNTKESLMQEIMNDPHSPHKIRVIGTLSNSPEFAAAFGCDKNSPMNPLKKCIIW